MTGTAQLDYSGRVQSTRGRVVRAAKRHSRFVRVLRIGLPTLAALVVLGIAGVMMFDPRLLLAVQLDADSVGIAGSKIIMQRPRLTGYGKEGGGGKGYDVTAERAEQSLTNP